MPKSDNKNKADNQERQMVINAQYIKDLSFESPGAPGSLVGNREKPRIDVSVDVQVQKLAESSFEVCLVISANAVLDEKKKLFLAELAYAGIFSIDVPDAELEPILMIYCPSMLFPYARRIVSDVVRDGGFPPLMLDPIDFAVLYQSHKAAEAKAKKAN